MDYIDRLSSRIEEIYKAAEQAKHPSNVGALPGVLKGDGTVTIKGKNYYAVFVSAVREVAGVRVWCQLVDNYRAVVIGGA